MPSVRQPDGSAAPWNKRFFDLVLAGLVALFILSWMIPLISLAIVITSPGPPLYIQLRTGRHGIHFPCLKFRTMYYDRHAPFSQVIPDDPRVTSLGRLLRRTNLDEMPQFLNVLVGTMSIVGPRPHAVHHDVQYWNELPNYGQRYSILPGITGLAQIRGHRGLTSGPRQMEHRLRYDQFYIRKRTLTLDLLICWRTFAKMMTGRTNGH